MTTSDDLLRSCLSFAEDQYLIKCLPRPCKTVYHSFFTLEDKSDVTQQLTSELSWISKYKMILLKMKDIFFLLFSKWLWEKFFKFATIQQQRLHSSAVVIAGIRWELSRGSTLEYVNGFYNVKICFWSDFYTQTSVLLLVNCIVPQSKWSERVISSCGYIE